MLNEALIQTWFITLGLAVFSLIAAAILCRTWVTAAAGYWGGWLFVLAAAIICDYNDWNYCYTSPEACQAINRLHFGAVIGFLVGSLLAGPVAQKLTAEKARNIIQRINVIDSVLSSKVLFGVFILGSIFLATRLASLGGDVSLRDLRSAFLEQQFTWTEWAGTHLYLIMCALTALAGVRDGILGVRPLRLVTFVLVSTPLGMANAGRIFLLQLLIVYFACLLISRSQLPARAKPPARSQFAKFSPVLIGCLLIFALIGDVRGQSSSSEGSGFNPFKLILPWPASSIAALDSWINVANSFTRSDGAFTFDWIARNLDRMGVVDLSNTETELKAAVKGLKERDDAAAVIPRTILPELIMDFGASNLALAMALLAAGLQFMSIRFRGSDFFGLVLTAVLVLAAALTIQGGVFRPDIIMITVWTGVFSMLAVKRSAAAAQEDFEPMEFSDTGSWA